MRAAKGSTITVVTDPFDATPSSPTVTVTREDGTVLTAPTGTVNGDGSVSVPLTAADHLDELDQLTVAVSATVGSGVQVVEFVVDVIGSHWLTLGALRREPHLGDEGKIPDWLLRDLRDAVESHVEDLCNVRMTPGYGVERHRCTGRRLTLNANEVTAVRAVTVDETAGTLSDFTLEAHDTIEGPLVGDVTVRFEHGLTRPPERLVWETRRAMQTVVLKRGANTPTDKIRETSGADGVTVQYSTPDPRAMRFTGMMDLDPLIHLYGRSEIGVA